MSRRTDYKMKKYYYITFIAMAATVCLQISYIFSLYNQDVVEDIINISEVTKRIIEDEKWIRSDLRSGRPIQTCA